jgi:hypothetical protein
MALIPLKARSRIAALTFAAAMAPFVSATLPKRSPLTCLSPSALAIR